MLAVFGTRCHHIPIHDGWKPIFILMYQPPSVYFTSWASHSKPATWLLIITRPSFLHHGLYIMDVVPPIMVLYGVWQARIRNLPIWMLFLWQNCYNIKGDFCMKRVLCF